MKCIGKDSAFFIGILIALAGTAIPARATTSIVSCGSSISTSGNYVLAADLVSCAGDGIDINASNVSVNLNGHRITGPGLVGINVNFNGTSRIDHVAIQGPGLIAGFNYGILIHSADYSQVDLVTTANNRLTGVAAENVTFLTVASNVMVGNGIFGLSLLNSVNGAFSYNELIGNGSTTETIVFGGGMIDQAGSANTVNNNNASGNSTDNLFNNWIDGIIISSSGARVYANATNGNHYAGIHITAASVGSVIANNTSSVGNIHNDLQDDSASCGTDVWSNNIFFNASQTCIH